MNDNRRNRQVIRPCLGILSRSLPPKPEPCFCGSDAAFVDATTHPTGHVEAYRVTCAHCGAEGKEASSYDAAVVLWNAITGSIAIFFAALWTI